MDEAALPAMARLLGARRRRSGEAAGIEAVDEASRVGEFALKPRDEVVGAETRQVGRTRFFALRLGRRQALQDRPLGRARAARRPAFRTALEDIMPERIVAGGQRVGIAGQVIGGVEPGGGIAQMAPAEEIEMLELVEARGREIGVLEGVIGIVEMGREQRQPAIAIEARRRRRPARLGRLVAAFRDRRLICGLDVSRPQFGRRPLHASHPHHEAEPARPAASISPMPPLRSLRPRADERDGRDRRRECAPRARRSRAPPARGRAAGPRDGRRRRRGIAWR